VSTSVVKYSWVKFKRGQAKVLVTGGLLLTEDTDRMKFAVYMLDSFFTFFHTLLVLFCITVYMAVCFV
jgi:hypothetical protein